LKLQIRYHSNIAAILSLSGLLCFFDACRNPEVHDAHRVMHDACEFLWDQQAEEGGWHSKTHTILRDGMSLTPFILCALLEVPDSIYQKDPTRVASGVEFVRTQIRTHLDMDSIPLILDYPNYAAAYALMALQSYSGAQDSVLIRALTTYLISQQFVEHRGIVPSDRAYGGWGFGETDLGFGETGHVDLSHTRRVLQSLQMMIPYEDSILLKARVYLDRVQNDHEDGVPYPNHLDGGFFTSIVTPETNKSVHVPDIEHTWYSYATATCDGLIARIATGQTLEDDQVSQAMEWLAAHQRLDAPEGIPEDDPLQWHRVMKYYHLAVRSEAARATGDAWPPEEVLKLLSKEQLPDGSFINPMGGPNKEDDPLLATTLTVIALNRN
jgi:hypothetical protein